jgi:hypothetical protein
LVTITDLDEGSFALDDLLSGKRHTGEPPPFTGNRSGYEPHPDAASCETEVARRNDTERRTNLESQRERLAEHDRRLIAAIEEQTRACKESDDASKRCVALRGDAKTTCLLDAQPSELVCREMTRRRQQLERQRTVTANDSMTNRSCVTY